MKFKRTMKDRMKIYRSRAQTGNAIVMLFAAIGIAGIIGVGLNTIIRGPAATTAELSRRTIVDNNLIATTRLAIAQASKNPTTHGDCDGDGFVEPIEYRVGGAFPAVPQNGGWLPMSLGASLSDPWGTQYGYCVWDPGTIRTTDNNAACGGSTAKRLNGSTRDDQPAIAVISAGANGVFETQCNAFVDTTPADGTPDTAMVNKPAGSDDVVLSYTYAEANGVGAGEWKVDKVLDPTGKTASLNKSLDVGGGASFTGALNAAKGLILPKDAGDDSTTGPCDASHDNQLRLNVSTDPPTLEMCNFTGGSGWTAVSGGSATSTPATTTPSCLFGDLSYAGESSVVNFGTVDFNGDYIYGWTPSGGGTCSLSIAQRIGPAVFTPVFSNYQHCELAGENFARVFQGTYVYSLYQAGNSFMVMDVSDPANPVNKATLTDATKLKNGWGLAQLDATHLIASTGDSKGVTAVDISNPLSPSIVSYLSDATKLAYATTVLTSGKYAYVLADDGLTVVDYTTVTAPVIVGRLTGLSGLVNIVLFGHYIIGNSNYNGHLYTIDISNPAAPAFTADNNFAPHLDFGVNIKVFGKYLFALDDDTAHITIFDLSDPALPVVAKEWTSTTPKIYPIGSEVAVKDGYLYQTGCDPGYTNCGVRVFNLGCDPLTGVFDNSAYADTPAPAAPDRLESDMIAHWPMDDATGTTVADTSGNAHPGTFVNTPVWAVAGPSGASSLNFNLVDRDAVQVTGLLGSPHTGTIAMWVNMENGATSSTGDMAFSIGDYVSIEIGTVRGVSLGYFAGGSTWNNTQSNENIVGTGWHFITGTFDDVNHVFRIYVDGVLKQEQTYAATISYSGGGSNTFIARHGNGNAAFDFGGSIDEVRVYNKVLGPSEVKTLYNRQKGNSLFGHFSGTTAANNYQQSKIATGAAHSCGIKADNTLWCWGDDAWGQLGNGPTSAADQASPVKVGTGTWASVAAGNYTTCAIDTAGALWCWGRNDHRQAGVVSLSSVDTPSKMGGTGTWVQVSVGAGHACGVKSDGTGWCWGEADNGKVGNNTNGPDVVTPVAVNGSYKWTQISAGDVSTCGIQTNGSAWCWGQDGWGQLGNGATLTADQLVPSKVTDPGPWSTISMGKEAACGVKTDGSGWCWGTENNGSLGNGSTVTAVQTSPYPVNSNLRNFVYIDPFSNFACGLTVDGSMQCWGDDSYGKQGNGPTVSGNVYTPATVVGAKGWTGVAVGNDHVCGLKADGSAWCWGSDVDLQLGNGTVLTANQETPTPVVNFVNPATFSWDDTATIISSNPGYSLALGSSFFAESSVARGFGFTSGSNANLLQTVDSNQLLLETATTTASSQLTLRTAPNATATDYTTNLVAKWTMDAASGTTTTSAPGGYVGTLTNGPVWMPGYGKNSGSLYFDGVNDYVQVPNNLALRPPSASGLTIAAWIKLDGTQITTAKVISKSWNNHTGPTYNSYSLSMGSRGEPIFFETGHAGSADSLNANIPDTTGWIYVVGTYNSSGAAPQKKIYVNGVLSNSKTLTAPVLYDTTATGDLYMGRPGYVGEHFKGQVDDVRIYNIDLTAAQVAQLYAYQTSLYQTPRTIGIDGVAASNNFVIGRNNAAASNWLTTITPDVAINGTGAVGIGTGSPASLVDVNGGVRFGADYECYVAAQAGKIRYIKGGTPEWQYCNGTDWTSFSNFTTKNWKKGRGWQKANIGGTANANGGSFCSIRTDGSAWCWGPDSKWLGINSSGVNTPSPAKVNTDTSSGGWYDWTSLAVAWSNIGGKGNTAYGLRSNGTIWAWGENGSKQIGDNTTTLRPRPVQVKDSAGGYTWSDWKMVSGGELGACGLRANGTIWCWGECAYGSCGDGTISNHNVGLPVQVRDNSGSATYWTDWVFVATGMDTACGIRTNGSAWCWGTDVNSMIGASTPGNTAVPVKVWDTSTSAGFTDWVAIYPNDEETCGIRGNGQIYCWGRDNNGSAGDGTLGGGDHVTPSLVVNSSGGAGWSDWVYFQKNGVASCGIRADGTAWCWGPNTKGELGSSTISIGSASARPVQVMGDYPGSGVNCNPAWTDWIAIYTTSSTSWGIRANGQMYAWGDGAFSGYGNGRTTGNQACPELVPPPTGP